MDHDSHLPLALPAPAPADADAEDASARTPASTIPAFTPVPREKDRSNGWKPHVQIAFIEALADTGSVAGACHRVNRSTHGAYNLRRQEGAEGFRAAWEAALDIGMQRIEDTAMDRALNGVEVPVYSYGKLVGSRVVHNDRLLMFMLRNRARHRFGEGKRGPDAIDRMELARLRAKWRKEWEKEWGAEQLKKECTTIDSINKKIDMLNERGALYESPRVAAARLALDEAIEYDNVNRYSPWHDPAHELYNPKLRPRGPYEACPRNPREDPYTYSREQAEGTVPDFTTSMILWDPKDAEQALLDAEAKVEGEAGGESGGEAKDGDAPERRTRGLKDEGWK